MGATLRFPQGHRKRSQHERRGKSNGGKLAGDKSLKVIKKGKASGNGRRWSFDFAPGMSVKIPAFPQERIILRMNGLGVERSGCHATRPTCRLRGNQGAKDCWVSGKGQQGRKIHKKNAVGGRVWGWELSRTARGNTKDRE